MNKEALDILDALTLGKKSTEVAKYTHFIIYDPIARPRFIVPVLTGVVNDFRKLYMKDGVVYISEEITGNSIDLTLWDIDGYINANNITLEGPETWGMCHYMSRFMTIG